MHEKTLDLEVAKVKKQRDERLSGKPGEVCIDCKFQQKDYTPCRHQAYADMVNNECEKKVAKKNE